ncbi:response regulator transcription factor [Niallia endozanthoxylica]|uniref:Response regulator transcription factor n=1 Tax=Niallia endozanthoxylica TaxID=2036016 RepID=A0A5J5HLD0_9BACI|nr:response regulator transcription factor [Niallia endozanthoxylica]KAA9020503.1 response regulator transcription factor [Niallia endozanthoxylica]
MIKVLIVDDHPAVGEGTKAIIEQEDDIQANVIVDSERVLEEIKKEKYEVYLVDLYMPKLNGIELTKAILQINPDAIILIYTGFDIPTHYNLLIEAGVSGFISKTDTKEQLITAIRCAIREEAVIPLRLLRQLRRVDTGPTTNEGIQNLGAISLSSKEQQILEQISKGLTNKAIAINLSMSQRTIEYNLTKIFSKLGVSSRTEALIKAKEFGLISQLTIKNG